MSAVRELAAAVVEGLIEEGVAPTLDYERLATALLDAGIAEQIAEQLRTPVLAEPTIVNVQQLAHHLGLSPATVYRRADDFGAFRVGDGPKAPIRFDLEMARTAHARRSGR